MISRVSTWVALRLSALLRFGIAHESSTDEVRQEIVGDNQYMRMLWRSMAWLCVMVGFLASALLTLMLSDVQGLAWLDPVSQILLYLAAVPLLLVLVYAAKCQMARDRS